MMGNLLPSLMRTGVPIIYALLIHFGIAQLGLPDAVITDVATVLLTALLYLVLRLAERYQRQLGIFLGWIGAPSYNVDVAAAQAATKRELDAALARARTDIADEVERRVVAALQAPAVKVSARKPAKKAAPKPPVG